MHPLSPLGLSPEFFDDSTGFRTRLYWAQLITIAVVTPVSFVLNKIWTFSAVRGKKAWRGRPPPTWTRSTPRRRHRAADPESAQASRGSLAALGYSDRAFPQASERPTLYLKSLTLRGFKSFASATTLNFEPGITCVVGPNGSGKSNVVDALSWVMGEQGAKSLRGGKMEDVIFAGTAGRAPLGRAEVVLTIDNSDGALPIDYAEVTISRTMFRHGGSEYAINGNPARLLDVQELLSDSGIGREMHVIVGQGQLDSILQATPETRRGFIEEAAGVLKHRKRKEKALRKLEACEGNLNRLSDLLSEIRRQLKPLGRQAEVARKAAVIQAELRDAKARLLADELVQATLALESDLADERAMQQRRVALEDALERPGRARSRPRRPSPGCAGPGGRPGDLVLAGRAAGAGRDQAPSPGSGCGTPRTSPASSGRPRPRRAGPGGGQRVRRRSSSCPASSPPRRQALTAASAYATEREAARQAEEARLAGLVRAAADRREGLARLNGQVSSLRSRAAAAEAEIGRLTAARQEAAERADRAARAFTALETKVAGLDAGELGLDAEHERAVEALDAVEAQLAELRRQELAAAQERAALAARVEALHVGLNRKDASSALLAATDQVGGLLGSVAALVGVEASATRLRSPQPSGPPPTPSRWPVWTPRWVPSTT